jgi:DNA-directed RNA polymerase subunit F
MRRRGFILVLALGCSTFAVAEPVSTNAPGGGAPLPKNFPARMREKMEKLPPAERQKMLEHWQQFHNLPPEQRKQAHLNFQKFRNLTPEQREQLKQRFQKWQKMSPEEKTKVQENFRHWKQLSPQEREEMRKQHAQRPPASGDAPPSGPLSPAVKAVPAAAQSR